MEKIKVISCQIFEPYIPLCHISLDNYEFVYLEVESHLYPEILCQKIQDEIDKSPIHQTIILLYGLCGNALLNIKSHHEHLYIVKVHDCLGILLGSHQRFLELFKNRLSTGWSCYGLKKQNHDCFGMNKDELIEKYGEDNAEYLLSLCHEDVYVSFQFNEEKNYEKDKEVILGNIDFLRDILLLKSKYMMVLNPNEKLIYSENEVIKKEKIK